MLFARPSEKQILYDLINIKEGEGSLGDLEKALEKVEKMLESLRIRNEEIAKEMPKDVRSIPRMFLSFLRICGIDFDYKTSNKRKQSKQYISLKTFLQADIARIV